VIELTNRTVKCKVCGFEVTKNGYHIVKHAMIEHLRTKHTNEQLKAEKQNRKIQDVINLLADNKIFLWEYVE